MNEWRQAVNRRSKAMRTKKTFRLFTSPGFQIARTIHSQINFLDRRDLERLQSILLQPAILRLLTASSLTKVKLKDDGVRQERARRDTCTIG